MRRLIVIGDRLPFRAGFLVDVMQVALGGLVQDSGTLAISPMANRMRTYAEVKLNSLATASGGECKSSATRKPRNSRDSSSGTVRTSGCGPQSDGCSRRPTWRAEVMNDLRDDAPASQGSRRSPKSVSWRIGDSDGSNSKGEAEGC